MAEEPDNAQEPTKPEPKKDCPECGASVRAAAALCKECGYLFATGRRGEAGTPLVTAVAVDEQVSAADSRRELFRLARPVILFCAVALVVGLLIFQNRGRETWFEDLAGMSSVQSRFDRQFQSSLLLDYRDIEGSVDVRAADGLCLINIETDEKPSGLIARFGGKLAATGLACNYAEGRRVAGDGRDGRVVLYFNRRRYSSADCPR